MNNMNNMSLSMSRQGQHKSIVKKERNVRFHFENSDSEIYEIKLNSFTPFHLQEQQFLKDKKGISKVEDLEKYCLYDEKTKYIISDYEILESKFTDKTVFILIDCVPLIKEIINEFDNFLNTEEANTQQINKLKVTCKLIGTNAKAPQFANIFIVNEGFEKLINITQNAKANLLAYATEGISGLIVYQNACQYINENKHLIASFYKILVENTSKLNVIKQMLDVFLILQNYLYEKFPSCFLDAALSYSKDTGTKLLEGYCKLLAENYYEVKISALTIIVNMLTDTQDRGNKSDLNNLILKLREAKITESLEIKGSNTKLNEPDYKELLDKYQKITDEVVEGTSFQIEEYKNKIKKYEEAMASLNKRTEYVFQHQKFYDEIVADFIMFKKLSEVCTDEAGYYDPYRPLERYNLKIGKKINVDNEGRVNIQRITKDVMKDDFSILQKYCSSLKDNNKKLENEIKEYQMKLKEFINKEKMRAEVEDFELEDLKNLNIELKKNNDLLNAQLDEQETKNKSILDENLKKDEEERKLKQQINSMKIRFASVSIIMNDNFEFLGKERKKDNDFSEQNNINTSLSQITTDKTTNTSTDKNSFFNSQCSK